MKVEIKTNNPYKSVRVIGNYNPEKNVFSKRVKKSKHLFLKTNSWGIDAKYFTDVLLPNNTTIKIFEVEENISYKISAEKFKKNCDYFHFKNNRAQIFCPLRYFEVSDKKRKLSENQKQTISSLEEKLNQFKRPVGATGILPEMANMLF